MNFDEFKRLSEQYNVIPFTEVITADLITPVLAYLKIRQDAKDPFLLESVEGIGRLARFSFIGKNPYKKIYNEGKNLTIEEDNHLETREQSIFEYLDQIIKDFSPAPIPLLPYFNGGIVGYLGYENISLIEDTIEFSGKDELEIPDSMLGFYDSLIVFDHFKHQIILIVNAIIKKQNDLHFEYQKTKEKISLLKSELYSSIKVNINFKIKEIKNITFEEVHFKELVEQSKDNILNGDVFQIVLSKRFSANFQGDLINVYRALRIINPSPYMYFLEFGEMTVIGTSPEDLLQVKNENVTILPIAGTRRRGKDEEEDKKLEEELLSDSKEIAEHMMLVDLARNDLGRVCEFKSIGLSEKLKINRFSHVMHIVSRVEGKLKKENTAIDALKASFPAGTVTGAPKIRAIQLIDSYENLKRNVYAGAIGYIDFQGNLDMCIAIRTFFAKDKNIYWQAGAGIVADSQPNLEWKEINNKSEALRSALNFAEVIDENTGN